MNDLSRWIKENHSLAMLICCAVPLALILAVSVFNIPIGTIGTYLLFLLCPLMHIFMMRGMNHGSQHAGHHGGRATQDQPIEIPEAAPRLSEGPAEKQTVGKSAAAVRKEL